MKLIKLRVIVLCLLALYLQNGNTWAAGKPPARPNIIFFLVDDMGWMDCSVYGSKYYETPNIDRLAKRGIVFTNAYTASPLCSPTRASILTGKYPEQKKDPRGMQDNAIMGAMIESMDKSLGRIMDKLIELKMDENTIIIFFSDNGGNMYDMINGKTTTNNFPLKMGKGNIHEGGVKVPCIILWPGTIKPNQVSEQLISSIDFYPTLLDIAGLKPQKDQILDGESLYPLLLKGKTLNKRELYCHFPHYIPATDNYPSTSVRSGDLKLIRVYGEGPGQTPSFELYNLKNDSGENNNLAASNPKLVARLDQLIENHVNETQGIFPVINPKYKPGTESPMGKKPVFPIEDYPSY